MGCKKWKLTRANIESEAEELIRQHRLPRPIALYFAARNIRSGQVSDFLAPRLKSLTDPYRFPGIELAAKRIWEAIANREPILIHGDYDTDGITGSALLSLVLRNNGALVNSFIPHRFDDGYGFTPESLHKALAHFGDCKVLITVDCGITSVDAVAEARKLGIDTIITDHHEAGAELPDALAVINPKIYPELEDLQILAGAGTAFKLAHAFIKYGLHNKLGGFDTHLEEVLDYVALGTVADIVPLLGENRIMVKYGIDILKTQVRPGIRALIESSRLKSDLSPSDITFKLAPRINAAGRVGDANIALSLLESDNIVEAYHYAAELERFNRDRQDKEQEIYQEARAQLENNGQLNDNYALLVAGKAWHQGVIGIVASRLARDFNRPTIVLSIQDDGIAYGSGRSIGSLNLVAALSQTAPLLERYGGHPMAVGIGVKADRIEQFYREFENHVRAQMSAADLEEFTAYDGECELEELTPEYFDFMEHLAPFGHGNPKPVFRFNELEVVKAVPVGQRHTRGVLRNRNHRQIEFIAFKFSPEEFSGGPFDVLATPQLNNYMDSERVQLNICEIRSAY